MTLFVNRNNNQAFIQAHQVLLVWSSLVKSNVSSQNHLSTMNFRYFFLLNFYIGNIDTFLRLRVYQKSVDLSGTTVYHKLYVSPKEGNFEKFSSFLNHDKPHFISFVSKYFTFGCNRKNLFYKNWIYHHH